MATVKCSLCGVSLPAVGWGIFLNKPACSGCVEVIDRTVALAKASPAAVATR
jgi:hypothetical protein